MVDGRGLVVSDPASAAGKRIPARLMGVEAGFTGVELVLVGVPLAAVSAGAGGAHQVLWAAGVLVLALFVAALLRLYELARPIMAVVAARQGRQPVTAASWQRAERAYHRLPRESGWMRFFAWVIVALVVVGMAVRRQHMPPPQAAGILVVTLLSLAGIAASRTSGLEAVLISVRADVFPNVDAMSGFPVDHRRRVARVGMAVAGFAHTAFAAIAAFTAGLDYAAIGLLGALALPILLFSAILWWRSFDRAGAGVRTYFDVVNKATATRGLARDEPAALTAFRAAQALPYRLALGHGVALTLALVGAIAAGRWLLGRDAYTAARLLVAAAVVVLPATFVVMLSLRRVMVPMLARLGSRHHLPLDQIRSRIGLGPKLIAYLSCIAVVTAGFVVLGAFARGDAANPAAVPLIGALALIVVGGLILLMVRDLMSPVAALDDRSDEMARGELARPVPLGGEADEIGRLTVAFEEMRRALRDRLRSTESINVDLEREVRRRTEALERRNNDLRVALEKLEKAQEDLVRSEKLASMGRLVAGIAHEVNNPVNAVINTLTPLKETLAELATARDAEQTASLCRDAQEMLNVIERGADRTGAIVRALHNYSRSDEAIFKDVVLHRCATDTVDLLRHQLRDIRVTIDIPPELRVRGLASQLDQVLMNLVANAAQAIGAGGGTIAIGAGQVGDDVRISVSDTGPGMPPEVRARIFDPFFTTKGVGEGTGLGLSIVHGIIDRHGGQIAVRSQPGEGTTFDIVLPRIEKFDEEGGAGVMM